MASWLPLIKYVLGLDTSLSNIAIPSEPRSIASPIKYKVSSGLSQSRT